MRIGALPILAALAAAAACRPDIDQSLKECAPAYAHDCEPPHHTDVDSAAGFDGEKDAGISDLDGG